MVYVQGGTFTMGCTSEQGNDCESDEKPTHQVTLSSFYINKYEVTQALWSAVMGSNPSRFKGCDQCPVEQVSWNAVQEFIRKLNAMTGRRYRLPTEAEWEYAARGGRNSRGYKYSGSNNPGQVAWFRDNSSDKTHPVGQKQANELGLYDMSGNVYEWCSDWYGDYSSQSQTDPKGPSSGSYLVYRGGSWTYGSWDIRLSDRNSSLPEFSYGSLGFRLVSPE
jgi:formylglycine-generating enzyme required for sulfatase activity